jgi:hypothetical protein
MCNSDTCLLGWLLMVSTLGAGCIQGLAPPPSNEQVTNADSDTETSVLDEDVETSSKQPVDAGYTQPPNPSDPTETEVREVREVREDEPDPPQRELPDGPPKYSNVNSGEAIFRVSGEDMRKFLCVASFEPRVSVEQMGPGESGMTFQTRRSVLTCNPSGSGMIRLIFHAVKKDSGAFAQYETGGYLLYDKTEDMTVKKAIGTFTTLEISGFRKSSPDAWPSIDGELEIKDISTEADGDAHVSGTISASVEDLEDDYDGLMFLSIRGVFKAVQR